MQYRKVNYQVKVKGEVSREFSSNKRRELRKLIM